MAKKYLDPNVCVPELLLTRIEKHPRVDWAEYYQDFDEQFR